MAVTVQKPKRLRETASRRSDGEWDFDAIFNRELYPAIRSLDTATTSNFTSITTVLNRFVPRFVSGASNAVLTTDEMALICTESGSANSITFDQVTAATFTAGACIGILEYGAGQVTVVPSGITIRTAETLKTRKQYAALLLVKLRDDEWWLTGDMELA